MAKLNEIGEHALIKRLIGGLHSGNSVVVGPGDDCAVVRPDCTSQSDLVLTSDPLVQGIHFTADAPPRAIGHKAVGRVLSDIAAMGARPAWGLVDLVAPRELETSYVEAIYAGISDLADAHGLLIVGGDVAEGPVLELHVFGVGEVPQNRACRRSTAKPGDLLFVTGTIGGSTAGRHLTFEPRVREGMWLRDRASAMIDVSDGLAGDLRHLTDLSGVGCDLNCAVLPIAAEAYDMNDGRPPLDHALHDGEDFELLFTVAEDGLESLSTEWSAAFPDLLCTMIGVITEQTELIRCVFPDGESVALESRGYTHFSH